MFSNFKKTLYAGVIVLALFSSNLVRAEGKSGQDLGYSYTTAVGDGGMFTDGVDKNGTPVRTLTCTLFCENGKECGEATFQIYGPDNVIATFQVRGGMATLKFKLDLNDTSDPNIRTAYGMDENVMDASGSFNHLMGVDHRCIFAVDGKGFPVKCLKCVYLFKF